jgi:hypothetical protein
MRYGRRPQCVTRPLVAQVLLRYAAQLGVKQRKQAIQGAFVTVGVIVS